MFERFSLATEDAVPVALWCGTRARPIQLPENGPCYRLDFLEIAPEHRGGDLGTFALALACDRALELGAKGMVLGALPDLEDWYRAHDGIPGPIRGWNVERDLLPFYFPEHVLRKMMELADGYVES